MPRLTAKNNCDFGLQLEFEILAALESQQDTSDSNQVFSLGVAFMPGHLLSSCSSFRGEQLSFRRILARSKP